MKAERKCRSRFFVVVASQGVPVVNHDIGHEHGRRISDPDSRTNGLYFMSSSGAMVDGTEYYRVSVAG